MKSITYVLSSFAIVTMITLYVGCNGKNWLPGMEPGTTTQKPTIGCVSNVVVHLKNTNDVSYVVFFRDAPPGDTFLCESLRKVGSIAPNGRFDMTIRKGNIGRIVVAVDEAHQCSGKMEVWSDCTQASSGETFIEIP